MPPAAEAAEALLNLATGVTPQVEKPVAAGADPKTIEAAALADEKVQSRTAGKTVAKIIVVPGRAVNLVVK